VTWIIEQVTERGAISVDWSELERLQLRSWIRTEAASHLSRALTLKTAGILLVQQQGALEAALRTIRELTDTGQVEAAHAKLWHLHATGRAGMRLTQPFRVAIFGPPNVGKSSLINRIAGYERAIVSAVAGTTRELTTTLTAIDGWPVELYDSPGIRASDDFLEGEGLKRALAALDENYFDLILWAVDCTHPTDVPAALEARVSLMVVNKCDLSITKLPISTRCPSIDVSALTGEGLSLLFDGMLRQLIGAVTLGDGVLFSTELCNAVSYLLDCLDARQLQRSQQVLDALIQSEKPQFSMLMNEPGNRRSDYAN
jgi:tRNA modification GTPase